MLSSVLQEKSLNCWYVSFYKQIKFHSQLSWAWKKFHNLGPRYPFHTVSNYMYLKSYMK